MDQPGGLRGSSETEVDHLDQQLVADGSVVSDQHDVAGLEIAMDQAKGLGRAQRACDLRGNLESERHRYRSGAPHARFQRLAVNELHRIETIASRRFAEVEDARHIRVAQLGGGARLATETLAHLSITREARADYFQGHVRTEVCIQRQVSDAHRTVAEFVPSAVFAQAKLVMLKPARGPRLR